MSIFTYENSKKVKFNSIADAVEAAFSIRGLSVQLLDYLQEAPAPWSAERRAAINALHKVWEEAKLTTDALDDLIKTTKQQEA